MIGILHYFPITYSAIYLASILIIFHSLHFLFIGNAGICICLFADRWVLALVLGSNSSQKITSALRENSQEPRL